MQRINWSGLVWVLTILCILCMASPLRADAAGDAGVATNSSIPASDQADHDALRALVPVYEQAANQGKPELLKPYLDPEFSGVMVTGEEVTSSASLEEYWASIQRLMGPGGSYHVKVNVPEPAKISGDIAVAHGTTDDVVNAKGNEYRFEGRWTAVCRKRDGQWKLLRIQASMPPLTNPFVMATVRTASATSGVVAGICGLLVGWVLHVMLARRRRVAVSA